MSTTLVSLFILTNSVAAIHALTVTNPPVSHIVTLKPDADPQAVAEEFQFQEILDSM